MSSLFIIILLRAVGEILLFRGDIPVRTGPVYTILILRTVRRESIGIRGMFPGRFNCCIQMVHGRAYYICIAGIFVSLGFSIAMSFI